ncbi:hypothetical protein ES703_116053 [subsurface metagenome]
MIMNGNDVRVLSVNRPAQGAIRVKTGGAVKDLLPAVAIDVRYFDLVAAAAAGLAETVKSPEFPQLRIISHKYLVLIKTGLGDDRRLLPVQISNGKVDTGG